MDLAIDLKRSPKILHQYLAGSLHDLWKESGQDPFVRPHKNFPIGHTYVYYTQYAGHTALMEATLRGHSETVHVLVQHSADLNVQDKVCM